MDAQALAGPVIDDEDGGLALAGERRGEVGTPHLIDVLGADGTVVRTRPTQPTHAMRRLQSVFAGQA